MNAIHLERSDSDLSMADFHALTVVPTLVDGRAEMVCEEWFAKELAVSDGQPSRKDIIELYEQGKHRRYSLLFAVNGAAFAIGRLLVGGSGQERIVLGGMTVWILALAMAFFSAVMTYDIWAFGERMRSMDSELFGAPGKIVLALLGALLVMAWIIVGFVPAPGGL